jgi:hypothetical protein
MRSGRLVVAVCRLLCSLVLGAPFLAPAASYAQFDPPWDETLDTPLYLIHVISTSSTTGDIETDQYIVHPEPPDDQGGLVLPDGFGGTFGVRTDWSGGPYDTARAICRAAGSRGQTAFNFEAGPNHFSCADILPRGSWFSRLGTGGKVLVIGTGILVAIGVAAVIGVGVTAAVSALSAGASAAAAGLTAFAGEVLTGYLAGTGTAFAIKRLAKQAGKQLFKQLGRRATVAELHAAMLAAMNAALAARGMGAWDMTQFQTLLWGVDLIW